MNETTKTENDLEDITPIDIIRSADVIDEKFIFKQKIFKREIVNENIIKKLYEIRELIFKPARCSGCCVCVNSCPVNAISFAGYEMLAAGMPLIIDHTICVFCGICYALCPDRAFEFTVKIEENRSNEESIENFIYFKLKGGAIKLENCVNCKICPIICPANAINFRVLVRVDDLHERNPENKNEFDKLEIDSEKCKLCGICTEFCDSLVAIENDEVNTLNPFSEILLREDSCDFCGLCEYVCPNQAIRVTSNNKINLDKNIRVLDIEFTEQCIECGLCELACPYDGVKVEKSIKGEIDVLWRRLEKFCDLESCKACINVCKSKAWYIEEGKLKLNLDLCRFCRACANVCPEKLIDVRIDKIDVEWTKTSESKEKQENQKNDFNKPGGWMKAIERVLKNKNAENLTVMQKFGWMKSDSVKDESKKDETEKEVKELTNKAQTSKIVRKIDDEKERTLKDIERIRKVLKHSGYRRLFETKPEKFLEKFYYGR